MAKASQRMSGEQQDGESVRAGMEGLLACAAIIWPSMRRCRETILRAEGFPASSVSTGRDGPRSRRPPSRAILAATSVPSGPLYRCFPALPVRLARVGHDGHGATSCSRRLQRDRAARQLPRGRALHLVLPDLPQRPDRSFPAGAGRGTSPDRATPTPARSSSPWPRPWLREPKPAYGGPGSHREATLDCCRAMGKCWSGNTSTACRWRNASRLDVGAKAESLLTRARVSRCDRRDVRRPR